MNVTVVLFIDGALGTVLKYQDVRRVKNPIKNQNYPDNNIAKISKDSKESARL